jgi:short subunit dehydrogenase-like uncharacterized protein
MALMIYGCTGYMGTMVSEAIAENVQLSQICVLSGRSKHKVQHIANRLNLPWCALDLDDALLDHYLRDVKVLLNMVSHSSSGRSLFSDREQTLLTCRIPCLGWPIHRNN